MKEHRIWTRTVEFKNIQPQDKLIYSNDGNNRLWVVITISYVDKPYVHRAEMMEKFTREYVGDEPFHPEEEVHLVTDPLFADREWLGYGDFPVFDEEVRR